ncbi:HAD family hydrolase [Nesterenkonia sp. NBAIMH1]|uniref:HAD family hydrolase n=1 Tax=Nesterenkonia sp. NBAIMH1 TaxID=2600320 RepID=UPI001AEF591F|nr:HAD family hydrolase [Nesterenkonia sp. NBAIMH1]
MLIATDLDGTLVPNGSARMGGYTAEVLRRADAAGIHVVFVTGRPLRWMSEMWPHVGAHGKAVVSNGAILYDAHERRTLAVDGIEPGLGLELVEAITQAAPETVFAIECVDGIRLDPHFVYERPSSTPPTRGAFSEIWDAPAVKLLARNPGLGDERFRELVKDAVGNRGVPTWSGPGLVEISAHGITKASALAGLCADLAVSRGDVVAFGDMPNDLPMLRWAGTSYAMADADASVRAEADHVAPSCSEEGVAQVIESLLGGGDATASPTVPDH